MADDLDRIAEMGLRPGDIILAEVEIKSIYTDYVSVRSFVRPEQVAGVVRSGVVQGDTVTVRGSNASWEVRSIDDEGMVTVRRSDTPLTVYEVHPISDVVRVDK